MAGITAPLSPTAGTVAPSSSLLLTSTSLVTGPTLPTGTGVTKPSVTATVSA